jgi:hypothetical protein
MLCSEPSRAVFVCLPPVLSADGCKSASGGRLGRVLCGSTTVALLGSSRCTGAGTDGRGACVEVDSFTFKLKKKQEGLGHFWYPTTSPRGSREPDRGLLRAQTPVVGQVGAVLAAPVAAEAEMSPPLRTEGPQPHFNFFSAKLQRWKQGERRPFTYLPRLS